MKNILLAVSILLFILFSCYVQAEEGILFQISEPVGDDYGPGTYRYPSNKVFEETGLFDITNLVIKEKKDKYFFEMEFKKIIDPWKSKYGFSLPLIEIYIDNKPGGLNKLIREGANVELNPDNHWNVLLKISGWWVRAYYADKPDQDENIWKTEENPHDVQDVTVKTDGNKIEVILPKEIIGELYKANIFFLVGSFDPFGPDHYRKIENKISSWSFADPDLTEDDLSYAPRVIDIILPPDKEQEKILANFKGQYPHIYPVTIKSNVEYSISIQLIVISIIILALVLLVYKKYVIRNNKNS